MIHSNAFVWLHFPKTAGTSVERIFDAYFSGDRSIHRDRTSGLAHRLGALPLLRRFVLVRPIWHDSLADRKRRQPGFSWEGKAVVCGLRRLPEWLYSRHTYSMQRAPGLPHRAGNLLEGLFFERSGALNHADNCLRYWLPRDVLDSGAVRIIRVEHFQQDFLDAFSGLIPVERIPEREFSVMHNRTQVHDDRAWDLIRSNRERIYAACPYWAEVESRFYGGR